MMIGHLPLIAMRKRGIKPAIVFLNDWPCDTSKDWHNPGEKAGESWEPDHATVNTVGDVIQLLDLRFLVGLQVSISSFSEIRAKALFDQAKAHGAITVAACHSIEHKNKPMSTGWFSVWRKNTEVKNG